MHPFFRAATPLLLAFVLAGCNEQTPRFTQAEAGEALSAGDATVTRFDHNSFSLPSANLTPLRRLDFSVGNSFFRNPWVIAPSSTTARDGLGPLINTNACQNCHIKDGRGRPPQAEGNVVSMLVRLSIPAGPEHTEVLRQRGIVPFVKIDRGLEDEKDGVRLMKPIPALETLLVRAKAKGVFGTKMRSLINEASTGAIGAIVDQQFDIANRILDKGLMPIVEPEVNLKSKSRAECDTILLGALTKALDRQPIGRRVMLKLSMPAAPDLFAPLVGHPSCARVLALSGGYSQEEACDELAKNHALVASFSRALLQDLRAGMDDEEFDRVLAEAIERIYRASTVKTAINPV